MITHNRMTRLCILISVLLVTAVFSLADMEIRAEKARLTGKHGNWHIQLKDISEDDAEQIGQRSDVAAMSWYDVINYDSEEEYYIGNSKAVLFGAEESYLTEIMNGLKEGSYPKNAQEIMLSSNAKGALGIRIGDSIVVSTPAGNEAYRVSGFGAGDDMFHDQTYLIGGYLTRDAFCELRDQNDMETSETVYYVQFRQHTNIRKAIHNLKEQYGWTDETISENSGMLGIMGYSDSSTMNNFYLIAAVLFLLILIAGVLMISGSINSNVAQRTRFFGMLRCVGASRKQIIRLVRLEALNWCKTAIPSGIGVGMILTWSVCAILKLCVGGAFAEMPLFGLSPIGIVSGALVGIVTVLIAAQSPAKHAAKASPVAAVSGNAQGVQAHRAANIHWSKIETVLGVRHAVSAKKNLILMTGSFALSIILILGFSAGLDFAHALLPSLEAWTPDCTLFGYGYACSVDRGLVEEIDEMPGVKRAFANMYAGGVLATVPNHSIDHVDLVSYDKYMLDCAKADRISGDLSKVYGDSDYVLTIYNKNNPLRVGDKIQLAGTEIEVSGAVSGGLFADGITVICSEETFTRLMGESDYAMINVQFTNDVTEGTVKRIAGLAGENQIFSDCRENNRELNATYYATRLFADGFLGIISLITVFYIINSTSMSVSARIRQYGAMRAVGMDGRQLTKMIAAEVFTYTLSGCVVGCGLGLPLNRFIFKKLVTTYFGISWKIPAVELAVILLLVFVSAGAAVYAPAKRIRSMAVTDTINEL
ncbi:MAG: FtsX-like permease family protein [Lachnospiraceae bacterium]|nr:FtsX-like permease family protein [Lachnospiraceae bacterium]